MKSAPLHTSRIAAAFAIGMVLVIIIATVAAVWVLRVKEVQKWEKQASTFSILLAEAATQQMDFAYSTLDSIVDRIQDRYAVSTDFLSQRLGSVDFHQFLKEKSALSPIVEVISVLDAQGNVLNTSRQFPAPSYNLSDRDYFVAQRDNPVQGVYLSSTVRSKSTGQWMFFISHRLTGSDGEFIGVVILGLSPSFYANFYEKFSADDNVSISLLRNDFTYLARWPERAEIMGQKNLSGSTYELIHKQNRKSGVIITSHARIADGGKLKTRMAAIQSLEKYPLIINFSIDEDLYLAEWRKIGTGIAIIAIFSVLAVITAFSLLVSLLERREQDLITTTELKQQAEVINRDQAILLHNLTQQQSALKDFSDQLQAIFQNAADGIIMIDERGIIEAVNPAASSIYGYQERDVVGRSCKLLSLPEQDDFSELALNNPEFIRTGKLRLETESLRKDGQTFAVELAISEYKLAGKRKLVLIVRDISERRKIERMKSEFISTVSHELRTPLTAIRGALGLVVGGAMGNVSEKLAPLLTMAHKNSENLTRLINDLLDIQKIEAGKLEFVYEVCNLTSLLQTSISANQALAHSLGTEILLQENEAGLQVRVDTVRFGQILANLISNACKYSPYGKPVTVTTRALTPYTLRIEVIDQGPGIPEHFRSRIFEKFSQADSSDTRAKGGTGLGLAISQALAKQMHGEIGFFIERGEVSATHFYLDLPKYQDRGLAYKAGSNSSV